ncbi:hypothetical protein DFJ58DRAFT_869095 [Suillus subalutaceus]|uniref:uncharacterized protein n=1 Tax=Suillus subalutaceus TaxID=48586 RepID=UPI001B864427|nr:uncharacterized protein DFJ58DRAFT_869095 [Suillus subalutaceus]KAG1834282.1 hypothetical protein DFJ58DRAFT_869095 [Suillus subalutaceus]
MPLTSDEIAAIMSNTNNSLPNLPPGLPPPTSDPLLRQLSESRSPLPDFLPPTSDPPLCQPSEARSPSPERSEPLREANSSSWAAQNPTRSIIRPRMPPPRLTDAQKASRKIKRDQRTERTKHLHNAVAEYLDEQKTKIEALSRAHHITPKQINDIIGSQTHYRTTRKSQLIHALIHAKAKEVNADLPTGSRYSMAELREMVVTDPNTENLTREQKEAYIAALEEHRERKVAGVRAHNLAAARDVVATTDRIVKEMIYEFGQVSMERSLSSAVTSTTPIQSVMHGTDNSEDFWRMQYKQWACTQNQNLNERDSLGAVRKQVCKMILQGLVAMTGKKDIAMNYSNYETSVVETYGVRLVGWPHGVKFVNPSNIGTVGDIRKLRDALKTRTCYWAALSPAEVKTHASELDTRRSAGEAVRKPRKKRSDAGVPRKRKGGA